MEEEQQQFLLTNINEKIIEIKYSPSLFLSNPSLPLNSPSHPLSHSSSTINSNNSNNHNSNLINSKRYKLFEVSKSLLNEMKRDCYLIGEENNEVVLCSHSRTYSIKKVETSNSIYLVPPSHQFNQFSVTSCHHEYYEVTFIYYSYL